MQRSKLLAVAVATVVGLAAGVVLFTGGAAAAQWHDYEGDIFPGHAYGLDVPKDAQAIEVSFAGAEDGVARLAVFDPAGAIVGYYALGASPTTATIVQPVEGRYVLYVYEVAGGALDVRVNAAEAPALTLAKIPLAREDVVLTSFDAPQAVDQVMTANLALTPVFVTLLYEGSAKDLDATVSSVKGPVVTITDETGTAFSPGVWASQTGTRASDFANLAGGAYTVAAKAEKFEGTLVLTALSLDLAAKEPVTDPVLPPVVPPVAPGEAALFALEAQEPVAVFLEKGTLVLVDGDYLADQAEAEAAAAEAADENETHGDHGSHDEHEADHEHATYYATSLISIYAPDDSVLAVVTTDGDEPIASVEIPEAGEYVLYVRYTGSDEGVFAKLDGMLAAPETRVLDMHEEIFEFQTSSPVLTYDVVEFELEAAPLAMFLYNTGYGVGAMQRASVWNENGVVASTDTLMSIGPGGISMYGYEEPALFQKGTHTFQAEDLASSGGYTLYVLTYDRETPVEEVAPEPETPVDDDTGDAGQGEPEDDEEDGFPIPLPMPLPKLLPW